MTEGAIVQYPQFTGIRLLWWADAPESWMRDHGFKAWLCYCDAEVDVIWTTATPLFDADEPIGPENATSGEWELTCHNGHTLLVCHQLSDDYGGDVFAAPTTTEIVKRLATAEDIAAWQAYERPKPPWRVQPGRGQE